MKVSDITSIAGENIRAKYIKDNLVVKDYVPYAQKIVVAQHIVNTTMFDKDGHVRFNSPMSYLFYIMKILENWTNIEIDATHLMEEYDDLNKHGLIEELMNMIPESERTEFEVIYHMVEDDLRANELSTKHIFEEAVVKLGNGIGEFVTPLIEQLAKAEGIEVSE